nr:hypothetical protein [Accumulibacter sp.]
MEFYRDSARVATTFDAPHLAEAYGLAPGVYSFTARAIDKRGGTVVNWLPPLSSWRHRTPFRNSSGSTTCRCVQPD